MKACVSWLMIGIAAAAAGGCGYSHKELFPAEVRTVAVPIFANRSFYQGVEFDLTEAVVKEIELRTPYKVVPADRADTILEGTVVSVDQTLLTRQAVGGVPQEMEVRLVVNYEWKDLHSGRLLRQREGFESVGRYIPTRPVSEPYPLGQHEAVQRLATQIVSVMAGGW